MRRYHIILAMLLVLLPSANAQRADYSKLSRFVRTAMNDHRSRMRHAPVIDNRQLCALVRTHDDSSLALTQQGCQVLASFGSLHVASIPMGQLAALSCRPEVLRIEAGAPHTLFMDTTVAVVGALAAHEGRQLPQAFTGRGVVVGVQDIGFDLTHPNFLNAEGTASRIRCFWDQLSTDTVGSSLYVGADYTTAEALEAYAHSRDGLIQTHGTHTLGSAAGTGYDTPYRGIAYESDICLVSNAVTSDLQLIDSADVYKYTYATDVLGFKYIFDYATAVGKPCVISFSEGSFEDFRGDDVLFYAALDSLVGPGRILVASAGNEGQQNNYALKPAGMESARIRLLSGGTAGGLTAKSRSPFSMTLQLYHADNQHDDYLLTPEAIFACEDSLLTDTVVVDTVEYYIMASAYPSCFQPEETVIELYVQNAGRLGIDRHVVVEVAGRDAEVGCYRNIGYIIPLTSGIADHSHSIHSPGSAPSVICVGATGYRTGFRNYLGEYMEYDQGENGHISAYSSVGPTYDERIKPDVVAPGTNVISSYSSYYLENNPEAGDIQSDVAHFDYNGRTYAWNANSGTSMSTPVVAGCIALWLQARPNLTPADVIGVLSRTCRHYDPQLTYPNNEYGYGEVDAYRGLLDVLGLEGIGLISSRQPSSVEFKMVGDMLHIRMAHTPAHDLLVSVYSTSGALLCLQTLAAGKTGWEMSLAGLPAAVYAVQVRGGDAASTGSTLVRVE